MRNTLEINCKSKLKKRSSWKVLFKVKGNKYVCAIYISTSAESEKTKMGEEAEAGRKPKCR